jgi:hypothetical protein
VPRSLTLKARRFESWQEIEEVVERAPASWIAQRHPFVRVRRHRYRSERSPGLAVVPGVQ